MTRVSSLLRFAGAGLCAMVFVAAAEPANATPITFAASTLGCFTSAASCTPTLTTLTSNDLTYTGVTGQSASSTIDANTSGTATIGLGTFSIPSSGNVNPGSTTIFDLNVQFTDPLNSGSNLFAATLVGKITGGPNNSVTVDFSQTPLSFSFADFGGTGTFQLYVVNDPLLTNLAGVPGSTSVDLTGQIQNATFQAGVPLAVAAVPEPATLVLLGTGLIGVAARYRLRRP